MKVLPLTVSDTLYARLQEIAKRAEANVNDVAIVLLADAMTPSIRQPPESARPRRHVAEGWTWSF